MNISLSDCAIMYCIEFFIIITIYVSITYIGYRCARNYRFFTAKLGNMVISAKLVSKSLVRYFLRIINHFIKGSFTNGLCHLVGCQIVCNIEFLNLQFFCEILLYFIHVLLYFIWLYFVTTKVLDVDVNFIGIPCFEKCFNNTKLM